MSEAAAQAVLAGFAVFCRIGGCLMLMPGFSSRRVPVRVRLLIAVAVSLALAPILMPDVQRAVVDDTPAQVMKLVAGEMLIGVLFGFSGRLFMASLEMAGMAIAGLIGFGGLPGAPIDGDEPVPPLSSLITITATAMFFIAELHWLAIEALTETYSSLPPGTWLAPRDGLMMVTQQLSDTLMLAGRLAAPFIIYSVVINLAVGLTNKLSPQIPVFFVSLPFVVAGGLMLFFFVSTEMLLAFTEAFKGWLVNG